MLNFSFGYCSMKLYLRKERSKKLFDDCSIEWSIKSKIVYSRHSKQMRDISMGIIYMLDHLDRMKEIK